MQAGVVIVGGGQAGLEAAAALRTLGYDGTVTLICEEAHAPYQRPPLSKDFLAGKQEADSVFLRALVYYEKHRIDLVLGDRVTEINRGARLVHLAAGGTVAYERLILAVGARNRLLPLTSDPYLSISMNAQRAWASDLVRAVSNAETP